MLSRDYKDILGGLLLLATGLVFSWHAYGNYSLGTLRQMGPGMFPFALGLLLSAYGAGIMVPALFRPGALPRFRVWSPLFVLSGVAAFALTVRPFGLLGAIVAVTVVSSFAELKVRPVSLAILCAVLCLLAWLVFHVGLGTAIPMLRWPF